MAAPCASASMPARWNTICWKNMASPVPEAMVESALNHARILDDLDFREYKISVKASDLFLAVAAYQALAEAIDCPLHLGITEAGGMISGTVKSSIGMGMLLWSGIGDTIRVSLSRRSGGRGAGRASIF